MVKQVKVIHNFFLPIWHALFSLITQAPVISFPRNLPSMKPR